MVWRKLVIKDYAITISQISRYDVTYYSGFIVDILCVCEESAKKLGCTSSGALMDEQALWVWNDLQSLFQI